MSEHLANHAGPFAIYGARVVAYGAYRAILELDRKSVV